MYVFMVWIKHSMILSKYLCQSEEEPKSLEITKLKGQDGPFRQEFLHSLGPSTGTVNPQSAWYWVELWTRDEEGPSPACKELPSQGATCITLRTSEEVSREEEYLH